MALYIPPLNFGMVEEDLYRSGQPNELNFPFMEKLGLKKIIYLAPDDPAARFMHFVEDQGIDFVHLGQHGRKTPWKPVSEEVVITALDIIMDPDNYPLHIMDHLGRHRSGTVVGCLRKVQRWNLASIFAEYRRYAGSKVRLMNEQFIELFDIDLVRIPNKALKWLNIVPSVQPPLLATHSSLAGPTGAPPAGASAVGALPPKSTEPSTSYNSNEMTPTPTDSVLEQSEKSQLETSMPPPPV